MIVLFFLELSFHIFWQTVLNMFLCLFRLAHYLKGETQNVVVHTVDQVSILVRIFKRQTTGVGIEPLTLIK